jgi:rhodanese-related sulfurtransferase
MNPRIQISVLLLALSIFLLFFTVRENERFRVKPAALADWASTDTSAIPVDGVVRFLINETPGILLVDVREESTFRSVSLPGAINIPLGRISSLEYRELLNDRSGRRIFYSNGDDLSTAALTIAAGLGYQNCYRMEGGLNAWFEQVMNASFSGERLSARENALLTNRFEARRLFAQYNSLPDSLKAGIFAARQMERRKLDGGCE